VRVGSSAESLSPEPCTIQEPRQHVRGANFGQDPGARRQEIQFSLKLLWWRKRTYGALNLPSFCCPLPLPLILAYAG
jgi:hypothetical protein